MNKKLKEQFLPLNYMQTHSKGVKFSNAWKNNGGQQVIFEEVAGFSSNKPHFLSVGVGKHFQGSDFECFFILFFMKQVLY